MYLSTANQYYKLYMIDTSAVLPINLLRPTGDSSGHLDFTPWQVHVVCILTSIQKIIIRSKKGT